MFSPTLGRWIQNDPIQFDAGDPNLYGFVGNSPTNFTDPSGLQRKNGDDLFRDTARKNNVSDDIIETILTAAKSTECKKPGRGEIHNYCEKWVDSFSSNLNRALNEKGHKDGLKTASGGGINGPLDKIVFFVPGSFPIIRPDQDHTVLKITFKDGSVFYIDCSTISAMNINNLTGGESHIGLPEQIPPSWQVYPRKTTKPFPNIVYYPDSRVPNITGDFAKDLDRSLPGSALKIGPKN